MSRHHVRARCGDQSVLVVAGYDRPLRELFLQVLVDAGADAAAEDQFLYASLHEPWRDWTDLSTLTGQLATLGIAVPDSLVQAVCSDQLRQAGNRVVEHHADRAPTIILAG